MHTTGSLARALGATLVGRDDLPLAGIDSVDRAGPGSLTFIRTAAFAAQWARSRASAALVTRGVEVPGHDPAARALLVVESADLALVKALALFAPEAQRGTPGVHPSAVVDPAARVDPSASVGPCCVVGAGAVIGAGVRLISGVSVGRGATIGDGSVLHHGVYVGERCVLGRRCVLWPGVVVGADGFGYMPDPSGRGVLKYPHIGTVEIGDEVEVGANTCIDRAKFAATVIGDGTKIDNLCQIGHNVRVGRACLICG
ncbi:MAG: UDP-3-O-(3-hydroxymyristoyl)glucosamine N-acyltransferase, partial [Phycisphaerales bacterium]